MRGSRAIISAVGSSGNGVCDADNMLFNDGQAAEFWAGTENSWDQGGVIVSSCKIVDFGAACTPTQVCVEAWAGQDGCSGDDCGGVCDNCKGYPVGLDLFSNDTNSTFSYEYMATMYGDAMADPGSLQCFTLPPASNQTVRYVLVCRSFCPSNNNASSYNIFVDHVYME